MDGFKTNDNPLFDKINSRQYFDFLYSFVLDTSTSFGGQTTFTVNIFKIKIQSQNLIYKSLSS